MVRKQPIPTDFLKNTNLTILDKMLFAYLWSMTTNEDRCINFYSGNKQISQELKRGQVIISINRVAKGIGVGYKKLSGSIERLQKRQNTFTITRKTYGMVITRENYDSIIEMKNKKKNTGKTQGKHKENTGESSNKSVESDKTVKTVKMYTYIPDDLELDLLYKEYLMGRLVKEKSLTNKQISLGLSKLKDLSDGNRDTQIMLMNRSIESGRKSFFLPKDFKKPLTIFEQRKDLQSIKWDLGENAQGHPILEQIKEIKPALLKETGWSNAEYIENARKRTFN